MSLYSEINLGIGCGNASDCIGTDNCPNIPPDFCIKRNDTAPPFNINLEDCSGVVDLTGNYVLEVNIWIKSKLKKNIDPSETQIMFADNIGFNQIKENNILVVNRARNPEKMLITGFDENLKTITVTRGHDGTTPQSWVKGSELIVFRAIDVEGQIESIHEDISNVDGTTQNELVQTLLVYNFTEETSCLPGCYWLEFKLTELNEDLTQIISTRRFPSQGEGFLVKIIDSPTEG